MLVHLLRESSQFLKLKLKYVEQVEAVNVGLDTGNAYKNQARRNIKLKLTENL